MKFLHISDIHFNIRGYDSVRIRENLIKKIKEMCIQLDFILITGDCLYRYEGRNGEQEEIIKYIKSIAKACNCPYKKIYICQGNHDVNRDDNSRNRFISSIRNGKVDFSTNYDKLCDFGNEKFQYIYRGVTNNEYESYKVFCPKDKPYRIISLNSALISKDKTDCQKLKICNEKLAEISRDIKDDERVNILIMHHGIECLEVEDARKFEHWIEDNYIDVVHCGHTHRAAVETYNDIFRDVKQFTAGALVMDDYAVPSFYLCELDSNKTQIFMYLYTYSRQTEQWSINNHDLRKFKNGRFAYKLNRLIKKNAEQETDSDRCNKVIYAFNQRYFEKFGKRTIFSNKYGGEEVFDAWKMIHSLVGIGISYEKALDMVNTVINKITNQEYDIESSLSNKELKNIVYETILACKSSDIETEFEVSCWASRYARKYSRNYEMTVLKQERREKLNLYYIKNILIKEVMDNITGNTIFYEKLLGNELTRMAENIMNFLKKIGIFEIRNDALLELIKEYITQKPHPWLVNKNNSKLIEYHGEQAQKYIDDFMTEKSNNLIAQTEAAYHICASFLVKYDEYVGCTETSPIIILTKAINCLTIIEQKTLSTLPMQKYKVIQMKKDLEMHEIKFSDLKTNINILYNNIVISRRITMLETQEALCVLWGILRKLEEPIKKVNINKNAIYTLMDIFSGAEGFIVKAQLRELKNCFWIEPNWEEYERQPYHLGKNELVCVLDKSLQLDKIYEYLYSQNKKVTITEIVFAKEEFDSFNSEERKNIRDKFKGKYIRCIFIQKENFKMITENDNWRKVFYDVICKSRVS